MIYHYLLAKIAKKYLSADNVSKGAGEDNEEAMWVKWSEVQAHV